MSSSARFRMVLAAAFAGVLALAGAMLYFGRPAPRTSRHAGDEAAAEVVAERGAQSAEAASTPNPGGAPRVARKPLESTWRWLMGARQAGEPERVIPAVAQGGGGVGAPGDSAEVAPPRPRMALSERRPGRDPASDDSSPTLARILAVTGASPSQAVKIRELWRKHEDARRQLYAHMMPSVAPPEKKMQGELAEVDGEMEIAMIRDVLDQRQSDRLVAELHPPQPPSP